MLLFPLFYFSECRSRKKKRRRRALEAEGADDTHAWQSLLPARSISKSTLGQTLASLREGPELAERSIGSLRAADASIFREAVAECGGCGRRYVSLGILKPEHADDAVVA